MEPDKKGNSVEESTCSMTELGRSPSQEDLQGAQDSNQFSGNSVIAGNIQLAYKLEVVAIVKATAPQAIESAGSSYQAQSRRSTASLMPRAETVVKHCGGTLPNVKCGVKVIDLSEDDEGEGETPKSAVDIVEVDSDGNDGYYFMHDLPMNEEEEELMNELRLMYLMKMPLKMSLAKR